MRKHSIDSRHATRCRQALAALESRGWPTDAQSLQAGAQEGIPGGISTAYWLRHQGDRLAAVVVDTLDDRDDDATYPVDECMSCLGDDLYRNVGTGTAATKAIRHARAELAAAQAEAA